MTENSSLFLSYKELQNLIRWTNHIPHHQDLSLSQVILAASGAGAVTSFFLSVHSSLPRTFQGKGLKLTVVLLLPHYFFFFSRTPIELIKCKMQVQMLVVPPSSLSLIPAIPVSGVVPPVAHRLAKLPGPMEVLKTVLRTTGFRGLWLGQTGTLIRETGGSAAWFGSKEFTASLLLSYRSRKHPELNGGKQLTKKDLLLWESAVSGASAGILYNLALFPADTVKSTIQTEEELRPRAKGAPRPTFIGTLNQLYIKQGLKGLYAGCGITIARAVPSSGLIFFIYDGLCKRFP